MLCIVEFVSVFLGLVDDCDLSCELFEWLVDDYFMYFFYQEFMVDGEMMILVVGIYFGIVEEGQ